MKDSIKIQGFCRINLLKNGKVVGDSGWRGPNQITNDGFLNYLVFLLGASAGSSQIGFMAIGTGGESNATHATLAGEIESSTQRKAVTFGSISSTTAQFTASWSSDDLSGAHDISNAGLYGLTTTNNQLFAGMDYVSSNWGTDQDLNATYQIRFS
jgi:hypothetical protein